jgi:hypothetical protein
MCVLAVGTLIKSLVPLTLYPQRSSSHISDIPRRLRHFFNITSILCLRMLELMLVFFGLYHIHFKSDIIQNSRRVKGYLV